MYDLETFVEASLALEVSILVPTLVPMMIAVFPALLGTLLDRWDDAPATAPQTAPSFMSTSFSLFITPEKTVLKLNNKLHTHWNFLWVFFSFFVDRLFGRGQFWLEFAILIAADLSKRKKKSKNNFHLLGTNLGSQSHNA